MLVFPGSSRTKRAPRSTWATRSSGKSSPHCPEVWTPLGLELGTGSYFWAWYHLRGWVAGAVVMSVPTQNTEYWGQDVGADHAASRHGLMPKQPTSRDPSPKYAKVRLPDVLPGIIVFFQIWWSKYIGLLNVEFLRIHILHSLVSDLHWLCRGLEQFILWCLSVQNVVMSKELLEKSPLGEALEYSMISDRFLRIIKKKTKKNRKPTGVPA